VYTLAELEADVFETTAWALTDPTDAKPMPSRPTAVSTPSPQRGNLAAPLVRAHVARGLVNILTTSDPPVTGDFDSLGVRKFR
jgi:hypothetical protein